MDRRELHYQAMLRQLGAAYYQAVHGQGSAAKVASAVQAVDKADADTTATAATGTPSYKARRWRICDVMTAPALSVTEHTSYKQVARLLSEHRLSALPVLSRALDMTRRMYGDDNWRTAFAQLWYGNALVAKQRYDDAAPVLHAAQATLDKHRADQPHLAMQAAAAVASLGAHGPRKLHVIVVGEP